MAKVLTEEEKAAEAAKIEEARALLEADAKEKADKSAKAAAKAKADAKAAERAAKTPEQRLLDDWDAKHTELAPFITQLGRVRGGLNLPDQEKAKKILRGYGIRV